MMKSFFFRGILFSCVIRFYLFYFLFYLLVQNNTLNVTLFFFFFLHSAQDLALILLVL